jgi:hypothetical protein
MLLEMHVDVSRPGTGGLPLQNMGVMSVDGADFESLSAEAYAEAETLRRALFLACLSFNTSLVDSNGVFMAYTADNFAFVRQDFESDTEHVVLEEGGIIAQRLFGFSVRTSRFQKPTYVQVPPTFHCDDPFLEAIEETRSDDPILFERLISAAAPLLESYYNAPTHSVAARVLLQTAAFEALLDLPERGQRKVFRERMDHLLARPTDKRYTFGVELGGGNVATETGTLIALWADRFYTLRNRIVHGRGPASREYRFLRSQGHPLIAPMMFIAAAKSLLDESCRACGKPVRFKPLIRWEASGRGGEEDQNSCGFHLTRDF